MNLPQDKSLPINFLSATFKNTSATYKYYWFLSLLQTFEEGGDKIEKRRIFARMLANAWYTVNYFRLSFGKQDKVQEAISYFHEIKGIPIDLNRNLVWEEILRSDDNESNVILNHFDKQVPHWFVSPWFPGQSRSQIYLFSKEKSRKSLYSLEQNYLLINPIWSDYLRNNSAILKDFCFWNLSLFLQKHNPNVPDIPNKLVKPISRASLNRNKREYWNLYFEEVKEQKCIYSGEILTVDNYVLDHFVPYNFVSHNLNWNLVPAHSSVNASKSDKLPRLDQYFNQFFEVQRESFEIAILKKPKSKIMEEYLTIFSSLDDFLNSANARKKFEETVQPLITIANNNGFVFYEKK